MVAQAEDTLVMMEQQLEIIITQVEAVHKPLEVQRYKRRHKSGFGYGGSGTYGSSNDSTVSSGGGGGFFGGGTSAHSSPGGGSGFIGNPNLTNKVMYCYNCKSSDEEQIKTVSTTSTSETPTSNYAK